MLAVEVEKSCDIVKLANIVGIEISRRKANVQ